MVSTSTTIKHAMHFYILTKMNIYYYILNKILTVSLKFSEFLKSIVVLITNVQVTLYLSLLMSGVCPVYTTSINNKNISIDVLCCSTCVSWLGCVARRAHQAAQKLGSRYHTRSVPQSSGAHGGTSLASESTNWY